MSTFLPLTRMWPWPTIWRAIAAGLGQAQTVHHVVQAQLQQLEHVVAGDALHVALSLQVVAVELLLQHAVDELDLLLFLQLAAVLRNLLAARCRLGLRVDFLLP